MASKRRLRRRACEGKVRHSDKDNAFDHLRALQKRGYVGHVYKCDFCGGYHVGRMTSGQKAAMEIARGY